MGQQQLLLIVLSVIVVGLAILVGINLFNDNVTDTNRDAVVHGLHNLAYRAVAYYKRPVSYGGGGNSFTNFTIPAAIDTTAEGIYSVSTAGNDNSITFQVIGTEAGVSPSVAGGKIQYTATITKDGVTTLNQLN